MSDQPSISVIVPAHDAESVLPRCLDALAASSLAPLEIIVVDDRSTDGTARVASERGARVLRNDSGRGPGAARNAGARVAGGELLLFVDADVEVRPDTLRRVAETLGSDNGLAAVFGSYDDEPTEQSFLSQYKNLQHHYVHQMSSGDAWTFWAGCGAMRRSVFRELGGFDVVRYPEPSIEDIELGYRMRAKGYRARLDKQLCVKHLKKWKLWSFLRTEIVCRALPWSRLILENRDLPRDLNLKLADRVSAVLTWLALMMLPLLPFVPWLTLAVLGCLATIVWLNRRFYRFLARRRGLVFVVTAVPLHMLYYAYSSAVFGWCWVRAKAGTLRVARGTSD